MNQQQQPPQAPESRAPMPDYYDRMIAQLQDLPDVVKTAPATVRVIPPLGIGGTQIFVVQTFRQRDLGETTFVEVMSASGGVRLVLPPAVTSRIARQHEALTAKVRSKVATATAAARRARGILPAFV